jgi:hypothetical protein
VFVNRVVRGDAVVVAVVVVVVVVEMLVIFSLGTELVLVLVLCN